MNYISTLPDFLAMQRVSFCWFITQGLTEELSAVSTIQDFSQNIKYIVFGEEYSLIKPSYSLLIARKYNGNYRTQLVLPIEIREKASNKVCHQNQFPMITLPLMTTYCTFIINGCERVIVSQIIRSSGIYFEKNKNQKITKPFRKKLSTDLTKLRSFIPSGEGFIAESDLFFAIPKTIYNKEQKAKLISNWRTDSIYYYSIRYLRKIKKRVEFSFLLYFKLYKIILRAKHTFLKSLIVKFFFKWMKRKVSLKKLNFQIKENQQSSLLIYFHYVNSALLKYALLSNDFSLNKIFSKFIKIDSETSHLSSKQLLILSGSYEKILLNSQLVINIQSNSNLLLHRIDDSFLALKNFSFLSQNIIKTSKKIANFSQLVELANFQPTIYFSNSFKDQFKYIFLKNKIDYKSERHKYLKTKTQLLLYKKNHELRTYYQKMYNEKELYTATLIPEY